jgi:putative ABC transport system substrate-binding protein
MRRRDFIGALGGAAVMPLAARAQQGAARRIGFLGITNASAQAPWTSAFAGRLRELGWIEGQPSWISSSA